MLAAAAAPAAVTWIAFHIQCKGFLNNVLSAIEAVRHWPIGGPVFEAADAGLINQTFLVGQPTTHVLQRVSPIFSPTQHLDIAAVTERLQSLDLLTPTLIPTRAGELWLPDEQGCWRLMTFIPGRTVHHLSSPRQAAEAGALVGRFHRAISAWDYTFQAPKRATHDTAMHMSNLERCLDERNEHPQIEATRRLGEEILDRWRTWQGDVDLPERPCHGDLKISNLRFDETGRRALCLLDLDTLAPSTLANELGDAWRSWCNPAGEDEPEKARLDLDLLDASCRAWFAHGPQIKPEEKASLIPGVERICLELSARFCADALNNCYFAEDHQRFPGAGTHNLRRAESQLYLARVWRQERQACEAILAKA